MPRSMRKAGDEHRSSRDGAGQDRRGPLQERRALRNVRARDRRYDTFAAAVPREEQPCAGGEMDAVVDREEEQYAIDAQVRLRDRRDERCRGAQREPEKSVT